MNHYKEQEFEPSYKGKILAVVRGSEVSFNFLFVSIL